MAEPTPTDGTPPPTGTGPRAPREGDPDPSAEDRFHQSRWRKHKGLALVLGGLAGGLAGYANTTLGATVGLPFALVSEDLFLVFLVILVAPVVEEHVKLFALMLLRSEEHARYTPRRWMILGAFAGAGFGLAEAALYWQALLGVSFLAANLNLLIRILMTVPFHALAVTASAYGYGRSRHEGSTWPLVQGLAIAIVLHAAFNGFQVVKAAGVFS